LNIKIKTPQINIIPINIIPRTRLELAIELPANVNKRIAGILPIIDNNMNVLYFIFVSPAT
jgi:hypothetical protein